jgi:hypothetical protein
MSVNVGTSTEVYTSYAAQSTATTTTAAKAETKTSEEAAVYEKSSDTTATKSTYSINKMSKSDRAALVAQLKQDQTNRQQQLSSLVSQMLSKQAGTSNLASLFSSENLKNVSASDIAQAQADVAEDGYWGVTQTSQRLFDFASALAGDDVDKMKEMQEAMEKGFKQATQAWGKSLPDICQQTISAANKLFEDYYNSKSTITE